MDSAVGHLKLTIVVGESHQWHHHALHHEIVRRAHAAGLAGASVFRGIEGFGSKRHVHTTRILSLSDDLPVMVLIVDTDEKIRGFIPQLEELMVGGVAYVEPVEVLTYVGRPKTESTQPGERP